MKVLVETVYKRALPVPQEKVFEIVAEHLNMMKKYMDEGKLKACYTKAGEHGGILIFDVESAAELNSLMMKLPLFPFIDTEIHNVMTLEEHIELFKKRQKK